MLLYKNHIMIKEFTDFINNSKKYGLKVLIRDLININHLYLQKYYIKKILNFAKENNLKFTFFLTAKNIKKKKKFLEQAIKDGHEIGSHSYNHIMLSKLSKDEIFKELKRADEIFKENNIKISGFRAPFLEFNDDIIAVLKELNYKYSSNRTDNKIKKYKNGIIEKYIISPYDWEAFIIKNIKIDNLFNIWKSQEGTFLMHPWLFVKYLNKFKKEFLKENTDYRIMSDNKISVSFDVY